MTSSAAGSWRAPEEDQGWLVDPAWGQLGRCIRSNQRRRRDSHCSLGCASLRELSTLARRDLLELAQRYTAGHLPHSPTVDAEAPIILTGHQPQLFHPGVWFKNFLVGRLAEHVQGIGIHLIVDNDLCRSPSVLAPTGSIEHPSQTAVSYDQPLMPIPYEDRRVADDDLFTTFGQRLQSTLAPLIAEPLIQELWPLVLKSPSLPAAPSSPVDTDASPSDLLGLRLAQGRHRYEHQWNNTTLEVPLSWLCRTPAFARFAAWLLVQAPRFQTVYNGAIRDYRRQHRVRSQTHPAPELRADQDWKETPFWLWSADQPTRRPLWACLDGKVLVLSDRDRMEWSIDAAHPGVCLEERLAQEIMERDNQGIRVRPRALITTLFARLLLGDLFVHGVGGAQYDRVTDALISSLLEIPPPDYAVATATLRLPVSLPDVRRHDPVRVDQQLRDLQYHAEQFLTPQQRRIPEVQQAIAQKQAALAELPPRGQRRMRHQQITRANQALQPWVDSVRQSLVERREELSRAFRQRQLLASREYAFCHFPADYLRHSLERMLDQARSQR